MSASVCLDAPDLLTEARHSKDGLGALLELYRDYLHGQAGALIGLSLRRVVNPSDVVQQRDLGVSLMRCGETGRAIDPLAAYLEARPQAADADLVTKLLTEAKGEVAKWN